MSAESLRKAVVDRFDSLWSGSYVDRGSNHKFDPPVDATWVRIQTQPFGTDNIDVGGSLQRTEGEIVVQCFAPTNTGERGLLLMADEVKSIFQNQTFVGVQCYATSTIKVGESGGWYQVNANTVFQYDVYS